MLPKGKAAVMNKLAMMIVKGPFAMKAMKAMKGMKVMKVMVARAKYKAISNEAMFDEDALAAADAADTIEDKTDEDMDGEHLEDGEEHGEGENGG